jgi:lipopolysaccharide transport system ATP-binding protein
MDKAPGSYVTTIEIPGHFLMPGTYTLSLHAFRFGGHMTHPLDVLDNVIRFSISETGTKVAKYNDHRNIGVILVNFPWHDQPAYQDARSKAEGIVAT